MQNVLIFGSTNTERHPGCLLLMDGLNNLIPDTFKTEHVSNRLLSPNFILGLDRLKQKKSRSIFKSKKNPTEYESWLYAYEKLKKDNYLVSKIDIADKVVVNVEGTIHNGNLYGRHLLALCKLAIDLGKPVFLVNCTIQNENTEILNDSLMSVNHIAVRDECTFKYLNSLAIPATMAFDTAFNQTKNQLIKDSNTDKKNYCLITGSVNKSYSLQNLIEIVRKADLNPVYIQMAQTDINDYNTAEKMAVKSYRLGYYDYKEVMDIIRSAKMIISGRHHMNMLSLLNKVPFIALPSNTWKIEGSLTALNLDHIHCSDIEELRDRVEYTLENYEKLVNELEQAGKKASLLVKKSFPDDFYE